MSFFTDITRRYFAGSSDDFTFHALKPGEIHLPRPGSGLYLHIPFCIHFCPYCPYNKVQFDKNTAEAYAKAVCMEIERYHEELGNATFGSLYIGGGTPTLLMNEIERILDKLTGLFTITGKLAIETHPNNIDPAIARRLKSDGFSLVSLGIQSFNNKHLRTIGRNYSEKKAASALEILANENFETLNTDLIFAIDGQTNEDIQNDLDTTRLLGANQVTCYPLFTFPYSEIGEAMEISHVKLPKPSTRKKMYYFLHDYLLQQGYSRTSVWSFNCNGHEKFSSVTRDYFLGLGAGAGSYNGQEFCFNTFDVNEYIKIANERLPLSLKMAVSGKLERSFWLYWRFYETIIPFLPYSAQFGRNLEDDYRMLMRGLLAGHLIEKRPGHSYVLTKSGSYYIHLIQNKFALNFVSAIWKASKNKPWPERIRL